MVGALLLLQPDLGMTVIVSATWFAQFFLAGLPLFWVVAAAGRRRRPASAGAYFVFAHVRERVDSFLDPAAGDHYQIERSLEAFMNGGLIGRGPGEGTVKDVLPDAHADFIFAVAGEEFGVLLCLLLVALFAFVVLRGMSRLMSEQNLFVLLATGGLLTALRPAGLRQHGLGAASDADQGHDPALHQLWRLVAAGAGARPWAWCWR